MKALCIDCGLDWNISVKADVPEEGYKCPRCRAKGTIKSTQHKNDNVKVSKVLLKNKQKFSSI